MCTFFDAQKRTASDGQPRSHAGQARDYDNVAYPLCAQVGLVSSNTDGDVAGVRSFEESKATRGTILVLFL